MFKEIIKSFYILKKPAARGATPYLHSPSLEGGGRGWVSG